MAVRAASGVVIVALAWLIVRELRRNWAAVHGFRLVLSPTDLVLALILGVVSYLAEARAWQRALTAMLGRAELDFASSVAVVSVSGLLKYIPGRFWGFGAQVVWLGRRRIAPTHVIAVNLLCMLSSLLASTLLGSVYFALRAGVEPRTIAVALCLVAAHAVALVGAPRVVAASIGLLRRLTGRDLTAFSARPALMVELGMLYVASWAIMGVATYESGVGLGLSLTPREMGAITSTASLSWVVGYASALTPGGIGVREGVMALMLEGACRPESALILPVAARILQTVIEVVLGLVGMAIGFRAGLFRASST
jgi:hypothetical protein